MFFKSREMNKLEMNKPFTIGVLTSGGDAPGMNAAIRAVVRTSNTHNADVLGVVDGYDGSLNGEFRHLGARDVSGVLQRGGTILQTSHKAPDTAPPN
jgi:6-phosphofructokinase 1